MIDIKHILKHHAYLNIPLNYEEAFDLGALALSGCGQEESNGNRLAQIQSIAALSALHTKATYAWQKTYDAERIHGNRLPVDAAEQIAGICAAVFYNDIAVSQNGFLNPAVEYAMDNCGMGGDLVVTANISTIAGFIAASAKIPMCKHGSPANADQGKYGSSDFISLICGIDEMATSAEVEKCIEQHCFGYTEALDTRYKKIHLQTHVIAKLPHMNDIIGPITNPLNPKKMKRRLLGINHLIPPRIVAKAYLLLNSKGITDLQRGVFIRGFSDQKRYEGMDEISICQGGTQVAELRDGLINEYDLFAEDFGLRPVPVESIIPTGNKGTFSLAILKGEVLGPPLEMALANAAILFYLADKSAKLEHCYQLAKEHHQSGQAYQTMLAVRQMIPKKR